MNIFKKYPKFYLTIVVILASGVFALLFILSRGESAFPKIENGFYLGHLRGVFGESEEVTPLIIEEDSEYTSVFVLRPGWGKIFVTKKDYSRGVPLEFGAAEARLRISGERGDDGNFYYGTVYNLNRGSRGEWSVKKLTPEYLQVSDKESQTIKSLLALHKERDMLDSDIKSTQKSLAKNKEAVEKLSEFLSDFETMNERASKKFDEVEKTYAAESQRYKELRKTARTLAERLAISERVTNAGNLVTLSRKTIERENRWLESVFESSGGGSAFSLDLEVKRAERILAIKAKLKELKD